MVRLGCTIDGALNDSKFSEPMPWIGLYVVAASAACAIAMALDAFRGIRFRKFWFPCKFFGLNATTLTLIGVAVKLSVDLNTTMPRLQDQLAKLSSSAFLCTTIGNSMPSLGTMETKELMMNAVALGILVVTVIVNICIQLGTGVIYVFYIEHAILLFVMVVLFATVISSSLAIPTTKCYLDLKYNKMYKVAKQECKNNIKACVAEKLRYDLKRYWMMALTCNPQFVMGRLATCTASGAFCLMSAMTLAEAFLRHYLMPRSFTFCQGESDYKWSTTLILVSHAMAVIGGTIGPASRWFIAIKYRCTKKMKWLCKSEFQVESYWIKKLNELKECPLNLRVHSRTGRKLVHQIKNKALDLCIWIQKTMVLLSKAIRLISIFLVSRMMVIHECCKQLASFAGCTKTFLNFNADSHSKAIGEINLRQYVLHLEGEEDLINMMMESERDVTSHWIRMMRKKQPKHLKFLLEKLNFSRGFEGVEKFDSHLVPSLENEEPPYCWSLPVVTLASIAVATGGNDDFHSVNELIKCLNEGLKYIRIVENNLDVKRDLVNIRNAAEIVWLGVDLHNRWLDVDLREMALQGKSPRDVLSELSYIAKQKFMELKKNDVISCLRDSPSKWPIKMLAANAMYRVCETLLLDDIIKKECSKAVFERITAIITDIVGACLTNLQQVISIKCHRSTIEERANSVRSAILLLGKTEKILEALDGQLLPSSDPEKLACINEWRILRMGKDPLCYSSSNTSISSVTTTSPDIYLSIDP